MGTLEDISLWYRYKTAVWPLDSPEIAAIHNSMRVMRSIRSKGMAYLSSPITSGRDYYEHLGKLMSEHGRVRPEWRINIRNELIGHQLYKGTETARELSERIACPLVCPTDLVPARQKWDQSQFMALWLNLIAEKITEVYMNDEWEYSNGCAEEFAHVWQLKLGIPSHPHLAFINTKESMEEARERMRNIRVYDIRGHPISLEDGLSTIAESKEYIVGLGLPCDRLERCHSLLEQTGELIGKGFYQ